MERFTNDNLSERDRQPLATIALYFTRLCELTGADATEELCAVGRALHEWTRDGFMVNKFPESVAGMPFNAAPAQIAQTCIASGNELVPNANGSLGCTGAPINPFPTLGEPFVLIDFCGGVACEISLGWESPPRQVAERIAAKLKQRYGSGLPSEATTMCNTPYHQKDTFRYSWFHRDRSGWVLLHYACLSDGQGPPHLSLHYRNAAGMARALSQAQEREASY